MSRFGLTELLSCLPSVVPRPPGLFEAPEEGHDVILDSFKTLRNPHDFELDFQVGSSCALRDANATKASL